MTDLQTAEETMGVDVDISPFPGADRIPWPSELAQNLQRNGLSPPLPQEVRPAPISSNTDRLPWPSEIAQTLGEQTGAGTMTSPLPTQQPQETRTTPTRDTDRVPWLSETAKNLQTSEQPVTSILPALRPRKGRPPPLDLKPWERYDHRERGLGLAIAVGPKQDHPPSTTHKEAPIGHEAPNLRTLRPLLPKPPGYESSESSGSTLPPKPPSEKCSAACLRCRKHRKKCSGDRPACCTCEKLGHECAY